MSDIARLKVDGVDGVVEVNLDPASWRGDVLETLEEHLGGESLIAWGRRWTVGGRLSEFRTRDIIALVYLGRATADPDTTWRDVSRAIAPYTVEFLPDEPSPPPVPVGIDPRLGEQVPVPGRLEPEPGPLFEPSPAMAEPAGPEDFYRTP